MAVTRPLGTMTLIPSVILLFLKEAGAGQPPEGIHKEQEMVLFFPWRGQGKQQHPAVIKAVPTEPEHHSH